MDEANVKVRAIAYGAPCPRNPEQLTALGDRHVRPCGGGGSGGGATQVNPMRRLAFALALVGLVALGTGALNAAPAQKKAAAATSTHRSGGHSAVSGSAHSSAGPQKKCSGKATAGKTTHVKGYTRKDGTYVAPHERRAPAPKTPSTAPVNHATPRGASSGASQRSTNS
jgi:hypothetical protein